MEIAIFSGIIKKSANLKTLNHSLLAEMEDSGIDSEDKFSSSNYECDVSRSKPNHVPRNDEEDEDSSNNNVEVIFIGPTAYGPGSKCQNAAETPSKQISTCKILQRKLELKVERAKRNYNQFQDENAKKSKSSNLLPISRLQIPGYAENQPLVEYKSESDDADEISFFPAKNKSLKKQDLTDTFSIQEMTIESDVSDDSESQNLELLPPTSNSKLLDKLLSCFYCSNGSST